MMRDLAEMVVQQGEKLDTFEAQIDDSAAHSRQALQELAKSEAGMQRQKGRQCLLCLLVSVVLLVTTLVAVNKYGI